MEAYRVNEHRIVSIPLFAIVAACLALAACAPLRLRDPIDLNANVIRFTSDDSSINEKAQKCDGQTAGTVCTITTNIALDRPMRLDVAELIAEPRHKNLVIPSISQWSCDIPSPTRSLCDPPLAELFRRHADAGLGTLHRHFMCCRWCSGWRCRLVRGSVATN